MATLIAVAARLDELAAVLRSRAVMIVAAAGGTRWQSPAARTYRRYVDETSAQLAACGTRLNSLADQVRSYAIVANRMSR